MKSKLTAILVKAILLGAVSFGSIAAAANPGAAPVSSQNVTQGIVGAVNPALPVQFKVLNETSAELSLGAAGNPTYMIGPSTSFSTKISKLPANLFVYIQSAQSHFGLNYDVSVNGNQVTVQVQQVSGDTPGDGAINIRPNGAVYIY